MNQASEIWRDATWRGRLLRKIGWLLMVKLGALFVLWLLFFSPAQRPTVEAAGAAERFGVGAQPPMTPTPQLSLQGGAP